MMAIVAEIEPTIVEVEKSKPRAPRNASSTKRVHGIPVREFVERLALNPSAEYAAKPNGAFLPLHGELAACKRVINIRVSKTFVVLNNHHVYDLAGFIAAPIGGN